jgi:predicted O-methyltransferase YrrM
MLKITLQYFWYKVFTSHRKGFGIHSPFVFHLVNEVLRKKDDIGLAQIKKWRKSLAESIETVETIDVGAGSKVHRKNRRTVRRIIRWSSISHKYGRVLYYLSREFQPKTILELGTGLGISTAYLSKGNPEARTKSVEADIGKTAFAESALRSLQIISPEIYNGSFDGFLLSKLKSIEHPLLVFIDGDHSYESTMRYFKKILEYKRADTIIVFDDIRWSEEMAQAWNEIKDHSQTVLSIDLFFMGIVFFREGVLKQNFKINF